MNSKAIINQVEILLYSSLISTMSEISHLRTQLEQLSTNPIQTSTVANSILIQQSDLLPEKLVVSKWSSIKEILLQLFMWIILGFAAGFLIGMIKPR